MSARSGRVFWWLWAGTLLSALATFVAPFLAMYLNSRGLRPSRVGLVVAGYGLGSLLAGPAAGVLSDAIGRRRTLLAALLAGALSAGALAVVQAPLAIAAAVLCFGAGMSASRPPMRAVVADVVPAAAVGRAFGWLYWAENAGASVSLVAGGLLAARGWALPFLVDAATTLGYAAVVFLRVPETKPMHPPALDTMVGYGVVLRDGATLSLLGLVFLVHLVYAQCMVAMPLDMAGHGYGPAAYGSTVAVSAVLVVALQPFSAQALKGLSPARTLALGALFTGLGLGAYGWCASLWQWRVATAVWTLGEIVFYVTASATVAALAPPFARGRYLAAYGLCLSLAGFASPLVGPAVLEAKGPRILWAGCLVLGASAAAGFLAWGRGRAAAPAPSPL